MSPMTTAATVIVSFMLAMWLLSIPLRNVSIVDIGWGLGFLFVTWTVFLTNVNEAGDEAWSLRRLWLPALVTAWSLRLSGYLAFRNIGKPEDYRYRAMRDKAGPSFIWTSLWIVFGLQGAVMWIVSLPMQMAVSSAATDIHLSLAVSGTLCWFAGFLFESIGDWQLARFKSRPENHGRVMDRGLWRWTRHPNYFGEFLLCWGHWLVSLGVTGAASTWWTIISPLLMTFLLLKVSGVAMLEKAMRQRSPEYEAYIARTSAFFPRPPRA